MESPSPVSFSGRLGREEWIEHLFLHVRRHAGAIVPDRYFDTVPEVPGGGSKGRFVAVNCLRMALRCHVKTIEIKLSRARVMSCGNKSASPAVGSNDRCSVMLNPCFSARAP